MSIEDTPGHGHINTPWWQTKKITEWDYSSPIAFDKEMVGRLGQPKINVNIRRRSKVDDGKDTYTFEARSTWFKAGEVIEAKTLSELEEKCERLLNEIVLASAGIKWTEWLEVKIARDSTEEQDFGSKRKRDGGITRKAELSVSYTTIKRAKMPDGRDLMLESGWRLKPFPEPKAAGEKKKRDISSDEYDWRDEDSEYAYIPATPENIAALDAIRLMIDTAGARLQGLLAQKSIGRTIGFVAAGHPLLTAQQ